MQPGSIAVGIAFLERESLKIEKDFAVPYVGWSDNERMQQKSKAILLEG